MRLSLLMAVFVLWPLNVAADSLPGAVTPAMAATAQKLMQQASLANTGYEIVESLTTEVGPRLAGTEAEGRARQWAVARLNDLGFHNVRVEPFEVPLWLRGIERAEIISPFPQPLTITALGGSASTGPEGVEGEVVSFESLAALEGAPEGSLQGKIVFVDEVMTRSRDGSGYAVAVAKRRKTAFTAQRLGASAALIRSVGTSGHRFAHTGQMRRIDYKGQSGVPMAALTAPDDTLDKIAPDALNQNIAAYAVFLYLAAEIETESGSSVHQDGGNRISAKY